ENTLLAQEQKEVNAAQKRKKTEEEHYQYTEHNAEVYCYRRINNPRLLKLAYNFSETSNNYSISHLINAMKYVNCTHCNALKLPFENDYNREFLSKIHLYDTAFTFTFLGVKFDYHKSILQYLQMYIWDTQYELQYRSNTISNSNLSPTILQGLKNMLDQVNPYIANFWSIANLPIENIENLVMCIHTNILELDQRTHNALTALQVAAI
ncbi:7126_t:CDS:2, partial [Gigaspora margarita]